MDKAKVAQIELPDERVQLVTAWMVDQITNGKWPECLLNWQKKADKSVDTETPSFVEFDSYHDCYVIPHRHVGMAIYFAAQVAHCMEDDAPPPSEWDEMQTDAFLSVVRDRFVQQPVLPQDRAVAVPAESKS
jgi:hypothetical protein